MTSQEDSLYAGGVMLIDEAWSLMFEDKVARYAQMGQEEQLRIMESSNHFDRAELARLGSLTEEMVGRLVEDETVDVVESLLRNSRTGVPDAIHERVAQRAVAGAFIDQFGAHRLLVRLREVGHRHLLEHGSHTDEVIDHALFFSPHPAIQEQVLRESTGSRRNGVIIHNTAVRDELAWKYVEPTEMTDDDLTLMLRRRSVHHASAAQRAHLRSREDGAVQEALVKDPAWPLEASMRVDVLVRHDRGREFLESLAPVDRSAWDALLESWSGTAADLLVASEALGRDEH